MAFVTPTSFTSIDKRQRTVNFTRARRPIDKVIHVFSHIDDSSQNEAIITQPTFPATMTGLRWDFMVSQAASTGIAHIAWAIVFVRDGETIDAISISDNSTFYNPEQNVLSFGYGQIDNHVNPIHYSGSTKTMRKMMVGDKISFISLGVATNTVLTRGAVQLFLKA